MFKEISCLQTLVYIGLNVKKKQRKGKNNVIIQLNILTLSALR